MTDPIKLSNERVREILAWASDGGSVAPEEIQALAQAVLDLRTTAALNDHTITMLLGECDAKREELDAKAGVVR